MTPNPKHMYRIDRKGAHAWYVQFVRNGIIHARIFSDSKYGSGLAAKEAATTWRDEFMKTNPVSYMRHHSTKRSSTHVVNVSESATAYRGSWRESGKRVCQSFAKRKFGTNALKMAMYVARIGKRIDPVEWMKINN